MCHFSPIGRFINRTEAYDHAHRIALVLFGSRPSVACPFTPLYEEFRAHVDGAAAEGDTRCGPSERRDASRPHPGGPFGVLHEAITREVSVSDRRATASLYDALLLAGDELATLRASHPGCLLRVLALSDGRDTASGAAAPAAAKRLRDLGAVVDAVAIGDDHDELLRGIVASTGGLAFHPDRRVRAPSFRENDARVAVWRHTNRRAPAVPSCAREAAR